MCGIMCPSLRCMWYMSNRILHAGVFTARQNVLCRGAQEQIRVVAERLEDHRPGCSARRCRRPAEGVNHVRGLDVRCGRRRRSSQGRRSSTSRYPLGGFHSRPGTPSRRAPGLRLAGRQREVALSPASITKTPIVMPSLARSPIASAGRGTAHEPVVLEGGEARVGHEAQLIQAGPSPAACPNMPKCGAFFSLKVCAGALATGACCGERSRNGGGGGLQEGSALHVSGSDWKTRSESWVSMTERRRRRPRCRTPVPGSASDSPLCRRDYSGYPGSNWCGRMMRKASPSHPGAVVPAARAPRNNSSRTLRYE